MCPLNLECIHYIGPDLSNIGATQGKTLEEILNYINTFTLGEPIFIANSTPTIKGLQGGVKGHNPSFSVKIDTNSKNALSETSSGLLVLPISNGKISVDGVSPKDFLTNLIGGGTDGIVTNTEVVSGGVSYMAPNIDIISLLTTIQNNTTYFSKFCELVFGCKGTTTTTTSTSTTSTTSTSSTSTTSTTSTSTTSTTSTSTSSTTSTTTTTTTSAIMAQWYYGDTDYFANLQAGNDIVPYNGSTGIIHNQPISILFPIGAADNKWQVIKVPIGESIKTNWFNTPTNLGTIPGFNFHAYVTIGSFNYIISSQALSIDTTQPMIFS